MKVAEGAFYFETVAANGVAMRAARNERHVVARRGHSPAKITSHGTRCHDRDPHLALSASKTLFVQRLARWKCLGGELDHLHQMDTPVASPPIANRSIATNRRVVPYRPLRIPPSITLPAIEGP